MNFCMFTSRIATGSQSKDLKKKSTPLYLAWVQEEYNFSKLFQKTFPK